MWRCLSLFGQVPAAVSDCQKAPKPDNEASDIIEIRDLTWWKGLHLAQSLIAGAEDLAGTVQGYLFLQVKIVGPVIIPGQGVHLEWSHS